MLVHSNFFHLLDMIFYNKFKDFNVTIKNMLFNKITKFYLFSILFLKVMWISFIRYPVYGTYSHGSYKYIIWFL